MRKDAVVGAGLLVALALPSPALAHVANVEYRFPFPVWVYAAGGAAAVLGTIPAAAVALRGDRAWTSGDLYRPLARLRLGSIALGVASALLLVGLVAAFANPEVGFNNPIVVLVWVDFWVGLGLISALVGNVWDFVSPLSAASRRLDAVMARRGVSARAYPEGLGMWPAVVQLLVFSWIELVWSKGDQPRTIGLLVIGYIVVQLAGAALFGAEVWLARGELFTVVARTFARLAPLELHVREPAGPCRAGRCADAGDRIGCPACWLEAPRERRGLRLRPYGAGIRREPPLGPGGSAFVVSLLATVVFDGLRSTFAYTEVESAWRTLLPGIPRLSAVLATYVMGTIVGAFALLFLLVIAAVARLEGATLAEAARRYGPTLIPIAAVYFVAHYFLYLVYVGQLTPGLVLDPLEHEWVPDYRPWSGVPGWLIWALQAGVIVWGHIVAVLAAHRVAVRLHERPARAVLAQFPLAALMVAYTFTGLWVLGQALRGEG